MLFHTGWGPAFDADQQARAPISSTTRAATLTSEAFYEAIAQHDATAPARIQALLDELEPMGVYADIRRTLNLKWRAGSGAEFSVGAVDLEGRFMGDYGGWAADAIGRVDLAHRYQEALATLLPGASVRQTPKPSGWRVVGPDGRNPLISALLDQRDGWLAAMSDYVRGLDEAIESRA